MDAVPVWTDDAGVDQNVSFPDFRTIYEHPAIGYFEISGGGMSSETMSFTSKEEFELRTRHDE